MIPNPSGGLFGLDTEKAASALDRFKDLGINLDAATQNPEKEGVRRFVKAFDGLMKALQEKQSNKPALKEQSRAGNLNREAF